MFYDLHIAYPTEGTPEDRRKIVRELVDTLVEFGYDGGAFGVVVQGRKLSKEDVCSIPKETPSARVLRTTAQTTAFRPKKGGGRVMEKKSGQASEFRFLTRLTVDMEAQYQASVLTPTSEILTSYDLVAVCPRTEKLWQAACTTLPIDIIQLDMTRRLPFYIKRNMLGTALRRGIVFEICIGDALVNLGSREYLFSNAASLLRVCKGNNVIVTSGAKDRMGLRGAADLANLAVLMGIPQERSRHVVGTYARSAIQHAAVRYTFRSATSVGEASGIEKGGEWVLGEEEEEDEI